MNSFVVDAAIAGSSYRLNDHVLCGSLQFNEQLRERFVDARVYSIEAKVSSMHALKCCNLTISCKVVEYVTDAHEASSPHSEYHKDFIGDLIEVSVINLRIRQLLTAQRVYRSNLLTCPLCLFLSFGPNQPESSVLAMFSWLMKERIHSS